MSVIRRNLQSVCASCSEDEKQRTFVKYSNVTSFLPRDNRDIAIAGRLSVCPSVCLSVTLVNCDHIGWEFFENNFTIS